MHAQSGRRIFFKGCNIIVDSLGAEVGYKEGTRFAHKVLHILYSSNTRGLLYSLLYNAYFTKLL